SLPNVTLAQKGWYTFTTSDSFCNTTSALDSFYLDVSNCQDSVWPGDVNLDFITNYLDVLYSNVPSQISNAHQGPARKNATINYVGQACPDWSTSLNNVNRKHSDCDGNGTINLLDTIAISQNYSLLHPKGFFTPKPKITAQADLYFDTTGIKFLQNTTISIPVVLGSVTHPINNFFGLGAEFKINSPQLLGFSITDTNSILGTTQQQLSFKKQIGNAQMDLVYSRLYYAFGVNGYGPLFNVVLSLPPNSAGDTVTLYFDNERLIDHTGDTLTDYNIIPLTFVIKDPLSIKETNSIQSASIIPNPSGKKARLDLKLTQKTSITVTMTDITGKHIWQWAQPKQHSALSIELPEELTAGLYFISVKQEGRSAKVLKWIKQ
ncbi:MAG TPA: T9SS type A sorting domain-containing protein, partial [Flavipsychrobacter sp.]|nr:T9SS type A sorting domain-containing protein [Flavipsychrobacter sp.]